MCRLLAYKGPSVILDDLLYEPEHSLINQSYNATEMEEPLNGDGFGVGWYNRQIAKEPAVFTSIQPAWNNQNLQYITPKISSGCVFAHVRSASEGSVNQLNCHPFHHGNLLMMHNGGIKHFKAIKRDLLAKLSDEAFNSIRGQTDSEHIFALFRDHLKAQDNADLADYLEALRVTISDIENLKETNGLSAPSHLNLLITDGQRMVGSRYVSPNVDQPRSLHFADGGRFECENNKYVLKEDNQTDQNAVLFVSEKLNKRDQEWQDVPAQHLFTVDKKGTMAFEGI